MSRKNHVVIDDDIRVPVSRRSFVSACILDVIVGSTGYQGGDSGHGGRTVLVLDEQGGTDIRCKTFGSPYGGADRIEIVLGGDCELDVFADGLMFAAKTLKKIIKESRKEEKRKRKIWEKERRKEEEMCQSIIKETVNREVSGLPEARA